MKANKKYVMRADNKMSTNKEIYLEINSHLLNDDNPSKYLNHICNDRVFFQHPFNMLGRLKNTKQSPKHHPEGNVWNHTMLVVDEAADNKHKSNAADVFMWAALLHDIGKPDTTLNKNGKITAYDHDEVGTTLAKSFLQEFTNNNEFIDAVTSLIRWHMQILFVVNDLPFADIKTMKQQVDINEVALLGLCDRLGRLNEDRKQEEENIQIFIRKCNKK